MRTLLLSCFTVAALSGCATAYNADSPLRVLFLHGFAPEETAGKLVVIRFKGNDFTPMLTAQQFVSYRGATLAKAKGKPYFALYRDLDDAARDFPSYLPRVGSNGDYPFVTAYVRFSDTDEPGMRATDVVLEEYENIAAGPFGKRK